MVVTVVSDLRAPVVDRPSNDLNIQKKLLLTCNANNAPEAMARPIAIGLTAIEGRTGPMMPPAVIAGDCRMQRDHVVPLSPASTLTRSPYRQRPTAGDLPPEVARCPS